MLHDLRIPTTHEFRITIGKLYQLRETWKSGDPKVVAWWDHLMAAECCPEQKAAEDYGVPSIQIYLFFGVYRYTSIPWQQNTCYLGSVVLYIYIGYVISTCFLQGKISNWQILQNAPWESHLQRLETDGRWWLPSGFPGRCDQLQQCHQRPLRGWCEGSAVGSTDLGGDGGAAGIPWKMPSGEPLWQKKKHGKTKKNWMKTINKWHLIMRSCWFDMILPSKVWLHSKENMKPER